MSRHLPSIVSPRRILAEILARMDYRTFQSLYWELRSSDLRRRYRYEDDFPVLEEIIRAAGARSLLDIGCGYGRLFDLYRRTGVRAVTGLELSDSLFDAAKQKAEEMEVKGETRFAVKKHDLREPLPGVLSVDLIVSARVLQHIHPEDIRPSVENLAQTGARSVYLNEARTGGLTSPYLFVHDYANLFATFGFRVSARGTVPVLDHDYLFLER